MEEKYIFSSPDVERTRWKNFCENNKLKYYKPHAFRHTWASNKLNNDKIPITEVKNLLGHKSIATTDIYAHPSLEFQIENLYKEIEAEDELDNIDFKSFKEIQNKDFKLEINNKSLNQQDYKLKNTNNFENLKMITKNIKKPKKMVKKKKKVQTKCRKQSKLKEESFDNIVYNIFFNSS